jgi:excisionase family DNA binding protein
MSTTEVQPLLLDITEVAKMIGPGHTKTWELIASGQIFSVRIGKRRLVPTSSVEQFVAELIEEQRAS